MGCSRRALVALGLAVCAGAPFLTGAAVVRPRCAPGSYQPLLDPVDDLPFEVSSPSEAFVIGADSVTLGVCGSTAATFKTGRHSTRIHARWPGCPGFGRVRLRGFLQTPPRSCKPVVAVLRWRDQTSGRRRALKFEALRLGDE